MTMSIPVLCTSIASRPSALGVVMHNAAYEAAGVPFTYVAFGIENTKEAVLAMRYLGIRGMGVSMPHKVEIMQYLDTIDDTAMQIGAVNTVVNDDGRLTGYNTDWVGAIRALKERTTLQGKRVVVIGAGGAARAVIYGLVCEGCSVVVYNRTIEKAKKLSTDFNVQLGGDLRDLALVGEYDILVNATSVGSNAPNESIVPPSVLQKHKLVLDVVFIPPETKLIRDATLKGSTGISGIRMLVHQGLRQFELYTGQQGPFEAMEQALLAAINKLN